MIVALTVTLFLTVIASIGFPLLRSGLLDRLVNRYMTKKEEPKELPKCEKCHKILLMCKCEATELKK